MISYIAFPDWIRPTIFPGFPVRWYGLMYLAAFAVTYLLFAREMRRKDPHLNQELVADFFFWAILGLLVGARVFHAVFFGPETLMRKPWLIVWPFAEGRFTGLQGMSYHGGLFGVVAASAIFARIRKIDLVAWADALAVSVPLGYTLGRVGNFVNGELVGRVTTVPWGVLFPNARHYPVSELWVEELAVQTGVPVYDPAQMLNLPRHPSQLYEAMLEGVLLWIVLWGLFRKAELYRGALMSLYLTGYGIARFFAGYFRETDEAVGFILGPGRDTALPSAVGTPLLITVGQAISLAMIVAGLVLLITFRVLYQPPPSVETFE